MRPKTSLSRWPHAYLSLEDFAPWPEGSASYLLYEDVLFVEDERRLVAIRIDDLEVVWQVPREEPAPVYFQVPRRTWAHGPRLWHKDGIVVHLFHAEDGVVLYAHDALGGEELWRRMFRTPAPVWWTEPRPAWPGAETEEICAFLAAREVLALGLVRNSRRSYRVLPKPEVSLPPFHAQLDITALDHRSGEIMWEASFPDVYVPILEKDCFTGLCILGRQILSIDWESGAVRLLAEVPGRASWPRQAGEDVAVAWNARGTVGVEFLSAWTGEKIRSGKWRRNRVWQTRLRVCENALALQINAQFVCLLDENLTARWEARVKPFVYAVEALSEGPVFVGTSGAGGYLYALDRETGHPLAQVPLHGGCWNTQPVDDTMLIVSQWFKGIVIVDGLDARMEVIDLSVGSFIVGTYQGQVVVVTPSPHCGVYVIDVRDTFPERLYH